MAITITNNSPIKSTTGTLYTNDLNFESKVYFTSDETKLYYAVIRDGIAVASGLLNGYDNAIDYSYRFDFDKYIKIDNQSVITFTNSGGTLKYSGNNSSTISLLLDTTEVIAQNIAASGLIESVNGVINLTTGTEPNELVYDYLLEYKFWDKTAGADILFETISTYSKNSYYPVTVYNGTVNGLSKQSGYDYTVYMFYMSGTTFSINAIDGNSVTLKNITVPTTNTCYNDWYFWNLNGTFDSLHCKGNANEVDTSTKSSLKNGNKTIYTKITIQKEIKQNTGFGLTEAQLYALVSSPLVYKITYNSTLSTVKEYEINTNSFNGYNGLKLGERNIEVSFMDPKIYQRKTNYTSTFFD